MLLNMKEWLLLKHISVILATSRIKRILYCSEKTLYNVSLFSNQERSFCGSRKLHMQTTQLTNPMIFEAGVGKLLFTLFSRKLR